MADSEQNISDRLSTVVHVALGGATDGYDVPQPEVDRIAETRPDVTREQEAEMAKNGERQRG
jgi:hypothetical protein